MIPKIAIPIRTLILTDMSKANLRDYLITEMNQIKDLLTIEISLFSITIIICKMN